MFERLFQWTSRNGARVLFAFALLILFFQVINGIGIYATSGSGRDYYGRDHSSQMLWSLVSTVFISALQSAALPLIGALVLDRLKPRD